MLNLYYSSQSGTSQGLAEGLALQLRDGLRGPSDERVDVRAVSVATIEDLDRLRGVNMFIMSSYGEGEPCDDGVGFFDALRALRANDSVTPKSDHCVMSQTQFALFGCGNSQYDDYQAVAKELEEILLALGGTQLGKPGFSDESCDVIDDVFQEWVYDTIGVVASALGSGWKVVEGGEWIARYFIEEEDGTAMESLASGAVKPPYHDQNPFCASLDLDHSKIAGDKVTARIPLKGSNLKYATGDHIGVIPRNSEASVDEMLRILGLDANQTVRVRPRDRMDQTWFPKVLTYAELFARYVEINGPLSRRMVRGLLRFVPEEEQSEVLALVSNRERFTSEITVPKLTFVEFVRQYNIHAPVPVSFIMESFGRLKPRFLSIASSGTLQPEACDVVVKLVKDGTFEGVLSQWLVGVVNGSVPNKVPIFMRKSKFKLPFQDKPLVLVGAGTGIAPLLGFLADLDARAKRKTNGELSKVLLVYGIRTMQDSLLRSELVANLKNIEIVYALSSTTPKTYVQDALLSHKATVATILKTGSAFVCGSARGMGTGVARAMEKILGGNDPRAGHQAVQLLKALGRYKEDVW